MSDVFVEHSVKIFENDWAYSVRPSPDLEDGSVDIAYEEGGKEQKSILVTRGALPALIKALQEAEGRLDDFC